jgi:hypothetical protein
MMTVVLPPGCIPGQTLVARSPNNTDVAYVVPPNGVPGMTIVITYTEQARWKSLCAWPRVCIGEEDSIIS